MSLLKGLIVALGSPNSNDGELYHPAKERCELALLEYKRNSNYKILLTGGFGKHFNITSKPHAFYLHEYLLSKGVPENDIIEYALSTNTLEDASLSKKIVLKYDIKRLLVITSDYHYNRARYVFEREYSELDIKINFSIAKTAASILGRAPAF